MKKRRKITVGVENRKIKMKEEVRFSCILKQAEGRAGIEGDGAGILRTVKGANTEQSEKVGGNVIDQRSCSRKENTLALGKMGRFHDSWT